MHLKDFIAPIVISLSLLFHSSAYINYNFSAGLMHNLNFLSIFRQCYLMVCFYLYCFFLAVVKYFCRVKTMFFSTVQLQLAIYRFNQVYY